MHLIIIPPKNDGYFVIKEPLEQMYDLESYNPYAAICYATRLREEYKEKAFVLDAQAHELNHASVKRLIKKLSKSIESNLLSHTQFHRILCV